MKKKDGVQFNSMPQVSNPKKKPKVFAQRIPGFEGRVVFHENGGSFPFHWKVIRTGGNKKDVATGKSGSLELAVKAMNKAT